MRTLAVVACVLASLVPCRAQNLLPNAEFDHDVSGWTLPPPVYSGSFSWDNTRSSFGPGGSALLHLPFGVGGFLSTSACVPVTPGVTYSFGADFQFPSAAGAQYFQVFVGFASDAACVNAIGPGVFSSPQFSSLNPTGQWRAVAGPDVTAPPGAVSALFAAGMTSVLDFDPHAVNFDHVYFGPRGTVGPLQAVTEVPTLSGTGFFALALGLGIAALGALRRSRPGSKTSGI